MQKTDELENALKHLSLGERLVSVARRLAIEHVRQELREGHTASANLADGAGVHTAENVEPDGADVRSVSDIGSTPAVTIPPRPQLPRRTPLRQDLFHQPMLRSDLGGKEAA